MGPAPASPAAPAVMTPAEAAKVRLDTAKLRFDEYTFRQAHIWKLSNWGALIVVGVTIVPWLYRELTQPLGWIVVLIFPGMSGFVSFYFARLINAEYARMRPVKADYESLSEFVRPPIGNNTYWGRRAQQPIGDLLLRVFTRWFIGLSILNCILLGVSQLGGKPATPPKTVEVKTLPTN